MLRNSWGCSVRVGSWTLMSACILFQVYIWVLNDDEDFQRAFDLGATGVMTDFPSRLKDFMDRNGISKLHWPARILHPPPDSLCIISWCILCTFLVLTTARIQHMTVKWHFRLRAIKMFYLFSCVQVNNIVLLHYTSGTALVEADVDFVILNQQQLYRHLRFKYLLLLIISLNTFSDNTLMWWEVCAPVVTCHKENKQKS